jgi:serine/threonine-protein kinase 24/25/MST4
MDDLGLKNMEMSSDLVEYMETYTDPSEISNEGLSPLDISPFPPVENSPLDISPLNIPPVENSPLDNKPVEKLAERKKLNKYALLENRGKGVFGEVWKAKNIDGKIVALKLLKASNKQSLKKEVDVLAEVSLPKCNPFLACYYDSFQDGNIFIIEMEYIDGIELDKWADKYRKRPIALNYNLILLMRDLSEALLFLYNKKFIHRDVKPANILITAGNFPKLVDFGLACQTTFCQRQNCCHGRKGTPVYAAPEILSLSEAYYASDIWSLGSSIYYASVGNYCFPFDNAKSIDEVADIIMYTDPYPLKSDQKILNQAVNQCLIKDPFKRVDIVSLQKTLYSPLN